MGNASFMRILAPYAGVVHASTPAIATHPVDLATEGVGWAFDAKSADAITHIGFRYGTRTGTPPTYIIGLEGVLPATGMPDGTYKTNSGNCTASFRPPATTAWDQTWQWVALDRSYTPTTIGERLMATIRYDGGAANTIDASNFSSFATGWTNLTPTRQMFPYAVRNTSGAWAAQTISTTFGIRTANDRYGCIVPNLFATRSASTVGHRQAAKINLPASMGDTYRLVGFRACASIAQATGRTPLARLWSGNTVLASQTMDSDQVGLTATSAYGVVECIFDTAVTLNCGTDYYVGLQVGDATSGGVLIYGTQFADAADNTEDGGGAMSFATSDGTTWTDNGTVRPWMELILDQFTEPTGGGGSVLLPRCMTGGYAA
jgi:hypothetical protein